MTFDLIISPALCPISKLNKLSLFLPLSICLWLNFVFSDKDPGNLSEWPPEPDPYLQHLYWSWKKTQLHFQSILFKIEYQIMALYN